MGFGLFDSSEEELGEILLYVNTECLEMLYLFCCALKGCDLITLVLLLLLYLIYAKIQYTFSLQNFQSIQYICSVCTLVFCKCA